MKIFKLKDSCSHSNPTIAEVLGVGRTQVNTMIKRKAEYMAALESSTL